MIIYPYSFRRREEEYIIQGTNGEEDVTVVTHNWITSWIYNKKRSLYGHALKITDESVERVQNFDFDVKRIMFFDIETEAFREGFSVANRDRIINISYCFDQKKVKVYTVLKSANLEYVTTFSNERQMLEKFIEKLKKVYLLISFNGQHFDVPFVRERCSILGLERQYKNVTKDMQFLDLFLMCSTLYPYWPRCNLKICSQKLTNTSKEDLTFDQMNLAVQKGLYLEKFHSYSRQDSLVLQLMWNTLKGTCEMVSVILGKPIGEIYWKSLIEKQENIKCSFEEGFYENMALIADVKASDNTYSERIPNTLWFLYQNQKTKKRSVEKAIYSKGVLHILPKESIEKYIVLEEYDTLRIFSQSSRIYSHDGQVYRKGTHILCKRQCSFITDMINSLMLGGVTLENLKEEVKEEYETVPNSSLLCEQIVTLSSSHELKELLNEGQRELVLNKKKAIITCYLGKNGPSSTPHFRGYWNIIKQIK